MVYLFITQDGNIEHFADKTEAQELYGYSEPDMVITEKEYDQAEGLFRLINGRIFLGKTDKDKKEELAAEKRAIRDKYLSDTDKYVLPDFPLSKEQKKEILLYRQNLRDLPQKKDFPYIEIPKVLIKGGLNVREIEEGKQVL